MTHDELTPAEHKMLSIAGVSPEAYVRARADRETTKALHTLSNRVTASAGALSKDEEKMIQIAGISRDAFLAERAKQQPAPAVLKQDEPPASPAPVRTLSRGVHFGRPTPLW